MKVEITKEELLSSKKCIKLIAENTSEEILLGELFEEDQDMNDLDWVIDKFSEIGKKDITIFKKK